jgi:hypothetical protein
VVILPPTPSSPGGPAARSVTHWHDTNEPESLTSGRFAVIRLQAGRDAAPFHVVASIVGSGVPDSGVTRLA